MLFPDFLKEPKSIFWNCASVSLLFVSIGLTFKVIRSADLNLEVANSKLTLSNQALAAKEVLTSSNQQLEELHSQLLQLEAAKSQLNSKIAQYPCSSNLTSEIKKIETVLPETTEVESLQQNIQKSSESLDQIIENAVK